MKVLLLLPFLATILLGVTLKEYTFYDKPDRVDIMLTFDAPWPGKISKTKESGNEMLLLKNVIFPRKKLLRQSASDFLQSIGITPLQNATMITLKSDMPVKINASKTLDKTGLRIRIEPLAALSREAVHPIPAPALSSQKSESFDFSFAFAKVILVMALLILALWFLKKWIVKKSGASWLFGENASTGNIKILAQKPIDMRNRILLIGYEEKKYLVLTGDSNLLLDSFEDEEAAFETMLQKHGKKLGDFLETP